MGTDTKRLILLFALAIIIGTLLGSCKAHLVNNYKLKHGKMNYYADDYKIKGDSIYFTEYNRNGSIRHKKSLKVSEVEITEKK